VLENSIRVVVVTILIEPSLLLIVLKEEVIVVQLKSNGLTILKHLCESLEAWVGFAVCMELPSYLPSTRIAD
jgi:hypothetical protein